jgi:thiamine biosynthesis lipoprotein
LAHRTVLAGLGVFLGVVGCAAPSADVVLKDRRAKMGTTFVVQVRVPTAEAGRGAIGAAFDEIDRVEALLSEWKETSEVSVLNRAAGGAPVAIGGDLLAVLTRASEISDRTGGAFDVTFAACGGFWSFREPYRAATDEELSECRTHVGWRKVLLDPERGTAELPDPAMRIGIAGIGKGYGVDRAAAVLESRGIRDYIVDGGGDIRLSASPGERPWTVGIAHPRRPGALWGSVYESSGAIVTSGDYEAFFERDGVRYHHILDPRTGRPSSGASAVTVIAPDATTADALATGLMVLGPEAGMALVESLQGVEALFLVEDREHSRSSGFPPIRPAASNEGG